jgi:hypothetical protein
MNPNINDSLPDGMDNEYQVSELMSGNPDVRSGSTDKIRSTVSACY